MEIPFMAEFALNLADMMDRRNRRNNIDGIEGKLAADKRPDHR